MTTMLETIQQDPQITEFTIEHPEVPASLVPSKDLHLADNGDYLVVSPYTTKSHLLNLKDLDISNRLLAQALTVLEAICEDYAVAAYQESFNWDAVVAKLKHLAQTHTFPFPEQDFYIVVFRSRIPPSTSRAELGALDEKSHAEATKSGGLLKYWFGTPDENGRNLATCIWRQKSDTRPASTGPGHKASIRATASLYTEWRVERLRFSIGQGAETWRIEEWVD